MLREKDSKKKNEKGRESDFVTKESFCATCTLFSFLALLILCSGAGIFGGFGQAICVFLTGLAGYCAYPLAALILYNSLMGLIGKKLINSKRIAFGVTCSLFLLSLILHTVQTAMVWGWQADGTYLDACLHAGETFPLCTVAGWMGGIFVYLAASLLSNVGALILFSVLFLASLYLTVVFMRGGKDEKIDKKQTTPVNDSAPAFPTPPMASVQTSQFQQEAAPSFASSAYTQTPQRPGVNIPDEPVRQGGGFSPFGNAEAMHERESSNKEMEKSYQNSREFLFGTTPAENYRQNLIYQSNSNANNLPAVDPAQAPIASGYTPSYTNAYADSMNTEEPEKPLKIVNDVAPAYAYDDVVEEPEPVRPITPIRSMEPIEPAFVPNSSFSSSVYEPSQTEREAEREEPTHTFNTPKDSYLEEREQTQEEKSYQRHDYMSLFSAENPNVFGRPDNDERPMISPFGDRDRVTVPSDRRDDPMDWTRLRDDREEQVEKEDVRPDDSGLHIFDEEPEDNPYALRSDYIEQPNMDNRYMPNGFEDDRNIETAVYEEEPPALVLEEPSREEPTDRFSRDSFVEPSETTDGVRDDRDVPLGFGDRSNDRVDDRGAEVSRDEIVSTPIFSSDRGSDREVVEPIIQPIKEEVKPAPKKPRVIRPYRRISLDELDCSDVQPQANSEEIEATKETILATLEDFNITGSSIASVTFGPTVTRYNVTIPRKTLPKKVVALDQSIAINLYSEGVNIYPNFEDGAVSIEVPNKERQFVQLGSMLSGDSYVNAKSSSLMFAMGKDVANKKVYGDIFKMTHILVAGASGSGKSVFLGSLIVSLIHKYSPEELRLILIDPKKTEFVLYNGLPHLMINEIITSANKAVQSLNWAIDEMERRYSLFEQMSRSGTYVVNLDQYNANLKKEERLPKIVIIIDELADLMLAAKKDIEDKIQSLTQKARATGIHVIVATQRPSTDVITGVIKSNLPTRIAFGVATDVDSRVILDQSGAQKLLGKGDMLYIMQGLKTPVRVQSAFISPEEAQKVVNYIKANNEAYYDEEVTAYINNAAGGSSGDSSSKFDKDNVEQVYIDALKYVILNGGASISMIQRKFSAGFNKAGKIIEWMEEMGYISPYDGAKARKVLITQEEFEKKYGPF